MMRIVFFLCLLSVLWLTACSTNAGSQAEGEVVPTAKEPAKEPDDGLTMKVTLSDPEIDCDQKEAKEGYEVDCTIVTKKATLSEWAEVKREQSIRFTDTVPRPIVEPRDGRLMPCPLYPGCTCWCWPDQCTFPLYCD